MIFRGLKIVLGLFFFLKIVSGQSLVFVKERIELDISKNCCRLTGKYFFQGKINANGENMIYYPFSENYGLSKADSIRVLNLSENKKIRFSRHKNGIIFKMDTKANKKSIVEVRYVQKTPKHIMEYILLSTKKWKRPLEKAEFIIKLNKNIKLDSLSMAYDYKKDHEQHTEYFITRHNFMPDHNLYIKWRAR